MSKKKLMRLLVFLMLTFALMIMTTAATYAYASDGGSTATPPATTEPKPTQTLPAVEPKEPAEPVELTPDGQLTLVDDIYGYEAADKQFLTVITKNGNYFYIVIDRAGDTENVHFLNLVDESDLLALIKESEPMMTTPPAVAEPEPVTVKPEPVPEEKGGIGGILAVVSLLAIAGGGALFYIKVLKPKRSGKSGKPGDIDFENFEFDDDELDYGLSDNGGMDAGSEGFYDNDIDIAEPDDDAGGGGYAEDGDEPRTEERL